MTDRPEVFYQAAGGVAIDRGQVLVLLRPSRNEIRLPKGHIEPGETPQETALREVTEESGYEGWTILADLGERVVEFDWQGTHVRRVERYFLMVPGQQGIRYLSQEAQFESRWLPWDEALAVLTFASEREWVRRAIDRWRKITLSDEE